MPRVTLTFVVEVVGGVSGVAVGRGGGRGYWLLSSRMLSDVPVGRRSVVPLAKAAAIPEIAWPATLWATHLLHACSANHRVTCWLHSASLQPMII